MAKKFDASAVGDMISGGSAAAATRRELVKKESGGQKKEKTKTIKLSIRVTPELKAALDKRAADQQRTISSLLAYYIQEELKKK